MTYFLQKSNNRIVTHCVNLMKFSVLLGYNEKAGPFQAVVNMGPVLLQRKKRFQLQEQFNMLEEQDVFKPSQDCDITIECQNPLSIVKMIDFVE